MNTVCKKTVTLLFFLTALITVLWGQTKRPHFDVFQDQIRNDFNNNKLAESEYHNSARDSNATLIGRWANGPCWAVDVSGDIACFGNGGYLEIADISDPANPVELGKIILPGPVGGVAIRGAYAYVVDGSASLRIIDISNFSNPTVSGFFDTGGYAHGVAVNGAYAYVADGWDGLRIIDISNPSNPTESGFFDTGDYAHGVAVNGAYAYVADGADGLYIIQNDPLVSIEDNSNPVAQNFILEQNYPNPFNPTTTINYALQTKSSVKLTVYDLTGRAIKTLVDQNQNTGEYSVSFDASNLASGIYFYNLKAGSFEKNRKMMLIR